MSVTEPLRREHADLLPRLGELDAVASEIGEWNADAPKRLRAIVEFLQEHLMPHARAEEAALYPTVEQVMHAPGATATMKADHAEIVRRIDALAATSADIASGAPTVVQADALRAQLYGLSAILQLHFNKEEEVLLPILDDHLTADDAAQLFTKMSAIAHPSEGTHR